MAINFSAQNSITIRRLTNGHTFSMWFILEGAHLFQSVDSGGNVTPTWSITNCPKICPMVMTGALDLAITRTGHKWEYDGVEIKFGPVEGGSIWQQEVVKEGKKPRFRLNTTNGQLNIVSNLASAEVKTNKTLTYTCVATVGNVPYTLKKSIDVVLQSAGTNSYTGFIQCDSTVLSNTKQTALLKPVLYCGSNMVEEYTVLWRKGTELLTQTPATRTETQKNAANLEVGRALVDGTSTFVVEFYPKGNTETCLYKAGIQIMDIADEYQIQMDATQYYVNDYTTGNNAITVTATLKNTSGSSYVPSNVAWILKVMDPITFTQIGNVSNTNSIRVSTEHTDVKNSAGKVVSYRDVEVWAEATIG